MVLEVGVYFSIFNNSNASVNLVAACLHGGNTLTLFVNGFVDSCVFGLFLSMVVPILIGLALLTAFGTGRAAFRAWRAVRAVPNSVFEEALKIAKPGARTKHAQTFLPGGFQDKMSYTEALNILGLSPGSSKAEILERHRLTIMANHPDKGGSNYFASKINEAKDMLLNEKQTG